MDQQQEALLDKAVFGKQVEAFLNSDVGKFMMEKASKEYFDAIQALRDCTADKLLQHQSDMKRAESIRSWLAEAVNEGLRACNILEGREDEIE
jgi:hypothetical protein